MYKGIVFDLDGTLIDSPLSYAQIRSELEIPESAYILEYLEMLPENSRSEKLARLERIEQDAAAKATPMAGVQQLLSDLRGRRIPLGIFTRNCRSATALALPALQSKFDLIVTREDAPAKPDPTGLQMFLQKWAIAKDELLFVGDFRFDVECGHKAGVKTAIFTNGDAGAETYGAHHVIHSYEQFWDHWVK